MLDEKKHKEEIIQQCKGLTKGAKDKKKCIDLVLNCHMNKCKEETIKRNVSQITEEERKQCEEKSNGDWKKNMKCKRNIMKKKGYFDADAEFAHCSANKCPEVFEYVNGKMKDLITSMHQGVKHLRDINQCAKEECPKELEAKEHAPSLMNVSNDCAKQHKTAKAQSTCLSKGLQPGEKIRQKYRKCIQTHCNKSNNKNTKNKNTKNNKTTKKTTKKHSKKY